MINFANRAEVEYQIGKTAFRTSVHVNRKPQTVAVVYAQLKVIEVRLVTMIVFHECVQTLS